MLRRLSFLILVSACAPAQPTVKAAPAPVVAAQALPVIDVVTLEGKPTQIGHALGGRPALVSLWATWCEACATEFEPLQRLSERAGSLGAVVIAVAVGEPRAKVAEFVKAHQLNYPQLVDEQFHFADSAGQKKVPATLVIDREGRIVYSGGVLDETALSELEKAITGTTSAAR
jgi:peroxiredoxin